MSTSDEWIVLELNVRAEGEDPDLVKRSIQNAIKGSEVFIPAIVTKVGHDKVFTYLVEGYAFARRTLPDSSYLRLDNTKFVQSVMILPGGGGRTRRLSTVKDKDIENFRRQIREEVDQGIAVGDTVVITTGAYSNIEAKVIEDIPERGEVQVLIELKSKQTIKSIPRSGLQVRERSEASPLLNRAMILRTWIKLAKPILLWKGKLPNTLTAKLGVLNRIDKWSIAYHNLFSFVHHGKSTKVKGVKEQYVKLTQLSSWLAKAQRLYALAAAGSLNIPKRSRAINNDFAELSKISGFLQRIRTLYQDVDTMHQAVGGGKGELVVQNVIVDGHNLAYRCTFAPGISELKDAQGRPTGMIVGFLRSLGSLAKRYPSAKLVVTWDGSSKRRKARFGGYKANRTTSPLDPFQKQFLCEILPALGVWQATNADEEADDVIASLVQGPFKEDLNCILTTDEDMLQLVTETTTVLVPGVGNRHEIGYTPTLVQETFGVPPEKMVQLRSFFGDTSDNLPGVPRVPKKVLKQLLQAHGSVQGVYNSGLVGLTKAQYERIRSAEPQVRINVDLMSLVNVQVSLADPDVDPQGASSKLETVGVSKDALKPFFDRNV